MKAVFVLFDALVRKALGPYGGAVATPNFDRLARKAVTFGTHYVGSLPCMPARRDLHTGRLNFLHRSWGPLEPFDNWFPELLRKHRVYTHLVSDHCHYFEDGGWTYHQRYSSWEFVRGQETDRWKAMVGAVSSSAARRSTSRTCRSAGLQQAEERACARQEAQGAALETHHRGVRARRRGGGGHWRSSPAAPAAGTFLFVLPAWVRCLKIGVLLRGPHVWSLLAPLA